MENPGLVEEISKLASKDQQSESSAAESEMPEAMAEIPLLVPEKAKAPEEKPVSAPPLMAKARRAQLLGALKPYVSAERAKAIDSMISVAEILDMMKAR